MHENARLLFSKHLVPLFKEHSRVLEIGPDFNGADVFKKLVGKSTMTWETIDIDASFPGLTYVCRDEYSFPIADNQYDIVFSSQVIEHVKKVWVWMKELARVCKPGGQVLTIGPVSWPYHAVPVDCWRIYPDGMKALYEDAGLQVSFSVTESLEKTFSRKAYAGKSFMYDKDWGRRAKTYAKRLLGFPVSYALDTVTAGVKLR